MALISRRTKSTHRLGEDRSGTGTDFVNALLILTGLLLAVHAPQGLHAEPSTATLAGRVLYGGPAVPDQVVEITRDSAFCGTQATLRTVAIHPKTRGLEGAVVSIDGSAVPVSDTAVPPLVLTNTRCGFAPRIAVGIVGQQLEIRNTDPVMHNTHISMGPRTFVNVAMIPASRPVGKPLKQPGIYTVKCDAHKFMQAHVLAFTHPYFGVTDETGAFRIPNLPAGEHQVTIWHETLGTFQQTVTVSAQHDTSITFEYPHHGDSRKP
ncbi:MAG: carboxypeptidase regulatory-like domain-containing protein [Nitrospira sp.]|nr:carboxypeptidase regulatory-like domain-containing protein [Nitrospira sp.]